MSEPTGQDRIQALGILAATFKRSTWSTAETEPIAQAIADARVAGAAEYEAFFREHGKALDCGLGAASQEGVGDPDRLDAAHVALTALLERLK